MNKLALASALLLLYPLRAPAQSGDVQKNRAPVSFEYEDKCGSPLVESVVWLSVEGTVVKVVDGDTIDVLTKERRRKRVDLAAVDVSASDVAARRMLDELVLEREVKVLVSPSKIKSDRVSGVVHRVGADVGRELIRAGVAKYKEPESYGMSGYTACVYIITEGEAREARRGLWQSAGSR